MFAELTLLEQRINEVPKNKNLISILSISVLSVVFLGGAGMYLSSDNQTNTLAAAVGGPTQNSGSGDTVIDKKELAMESQNAQERISRLRTKKAVLSRREEILRYQLQKLDDERANWVQNDSSLAQEYRRSRNTLVMLLKDQENTDKQLTEFLKQIWESEGKMRLASMGLESGQSILLSWPVTPVEGISAWFQDSEYETRFGIEHNAIDIPVVEMTEIRAAADGTVNVIADNGMGYNYIIIRHNGFATLYGHVREFLVEKGKEVKEGDVIALSGGIPGTPGAGALTTGAHLHFELITGAGHEDPISYLPYAVGVHDKK